MADEVKTKTTKPKAEKVVEEVKEILEDVKPVEAAEVVEEPAPVVEPPVVEAPAVEEEVVEDSEVEAMGRRGRRSKAEIAEQVKRTREDIESNYANLIAHEPAKADFFREELRNALKQLGL